MKKLVSFVLAATMMAASGFEAFAAGKFTDIDKHWAKTYIEDMAAQGYINGYEDNTFRPDKSVTRLEAILLFSRAMGANKAENKEFLAKANEKYLNKVKATGITFGTDEVCYMMARGILNDNDLDTFLANGKASLAMPRQEAAAIITKAMCAEEIAKAEVLVDLEYKDAKMIHSDYSQYVFYVSEAEIMNGMDDGKFAPESSVLRGQIATMLSRTAEKMNLYIETATVTDVDYAERNITIIDSEGARVKVGYTQYTKFFDQTQIIDEKDFVEHSQATLTYINDKLVFIDMHQKDLEATAKGIYQGYASINAITTVNIKPDGQKEVEEFELSEDVVIKTESGVVDSIRHLVTNSYVEYEISGGKIVTITQAKSASTITNATVESISIEDELYLTISHNDPEYDGMRFALNDDVVVYKNNDVKDLSKLYTGDSISITMEYGVVTKIKASSTVKSYNGTIKELVIAKVPLLRIEINGELEEYEIVDTISINVDGKTDATVYDLRVGDGVKVTVESGVVTKIVKTASAVTAHSVTGVIETVNASKGFIKINNETIFCKDATTKFITSGGVTKSMDKLEVGMTVTVRGSMQSGAYSATLIIIEE